MKPKKPTEEIIECTPDKKSPHPDSLILDGDDVEITPPSTKTAAELQEFNWNDNKDCIVVQHQPAIAIHLSAVDGVVIRQEDFWGNGDQVVYFFPEHAEKIAEAILALAKGVK